METGGWGCDVVLPTLMQQKQRDHFLATSYSFHQGRTKQRLDKEL